MRILMLSHYFDSHQGGIESVAKRMYTDLASPECHITWGAAAVTAPPENSALADSLPLPSWNILEDLTGVPLPAPKPGALRNLFAAVKKSDLLLLHDCLYLSNIIAFVRARQRGIPVMVIQHVGIVPLRNLFLRFAMKLANVTIARRMLSSAQQAIFISENTQQYFASVPFRKPPVLIFNGVDCDLFRPAVQAEVEASRQQLGLPVNGPIALFVGRFVEKKGLQVLHQMAASAPHITWVFAGAGPLNPRVWALPNVRVYSNLRGHGLAELYRASDIFVLPSRGEGLPLVIQEAMASGLPIVCSKDTAAADPEIAQFVAGVALSTCGDHISATAFLNAIDEILAEPRSHSDAAQRHRFARRHYSWRRAMESYFTVASGLVKNKTSSCVPPHAAGFSPQGQLSQEARSNPQ